MDNIIQTELGTLNLSKLPIESYKSEIINTIRTNKVTVIYGATGSGKTTKIPQYLIEAGINEDRAIAVTQPRRIAATSMAQRVAKQMDCALGFEVGYVIRFENKTSANTKIKFMTDGMLLSYCLSDRDLLDYSVVMIDEVHERSIYTDVLLGLLKEIVNKRDDLKVIIASATINKDKFKKYFNEAPIISFEGSLFPVEVVYRPSSVYVDDSVKLVRKIHDQNEAGDILIFLTGFEDIAECCKKLCTIENLVVIQLHGSLDNDSQKKVFDPVQPGKRKVVVSTNIAETTITIDGIKFVIDCGYVKQSVFNSRLGMNMLNSTRISKAQADQRKGRAGRTQSGKCFRLYSEETFQEMIEDTVPDILRMNLCNIYLRIVTIGLNPMEFDFMDKPLPENLQKSEKELQELGLLDDMKQLTEMGKGMSDLPVEPIIGTVLLMSSNFYCTLDVITILSSMPEKSVFDTVKDSQIHKEKHKLFLDPLGDHFTRLNVFNEFTKAGKTKEWCIDNFLNYDALCQIDKVNTQLMEIMKGKKNALASIRPGASRDPIRQAIVKGYYRNICYKGTKRGEYIRYLDKSVLLMHNKSCLYEESPDLILYHETFHDKKTFICGIMRLDKRVLVNFTNELEKIGCTILTDT